MIKIITTGGTFDKLHDEINGELTFKESNLFRIIKQSRISVDVEGESIFAVDSLVMTESQRVKVVEASLTCNAEKIIIIHKTDTIVKTAKILKERNINKTIVLNGSMIPYSLVNSDAVFNLGCSISAADNVIKNKEKGIFEVIK